MTDEHVTATCPYKCQYSTTARVGQRQASDPQVNRQVRPVRLHHPKDVSRPTEVTGPNITRYQAEGQQALGVTEDQLAKDLEGPFIEVVGKGRRAGRKNQHLSNKPAQG